MSSKTQAGKQKAEFRKILLRRDFYELLKFGKSIRNPFRGLVSLLFDEDDLVQWRAIEAIGRVAAEIGSTDLEKVQNQIHHLFWMMNDESGALCRRGPETIAEILVNVPQFMPEYIQRLPSFLWEEPFEAGSRIAMHRVLSISPDMLSVFNPSIDDLIKSLEHRDELIRGYSLLLLQKMNSIDGKQQIDIPEIDKVVVPVYDFSSGELKQESIA